MDVKLTVDLAPSTVRKTIEHLAPYTATHLNRIGGSLIGADRVLRGLTLVTDVSAGTVTVEPGAFIAGGVIVDVLERVDLDYSDLLEDGALPIISGRTQSIILYAYTEDAKSSSEIRFGFILDPDLQDIDSTGYVVLGVLSPEDEQGDVQLGSWTTPYGYSTDDLARDTRDGVQNVEAAPFASDTGLRLPNPNFRTGPFFLHDRELLVFADRFLIPSMRIAPTYPVRFARRGVLGISEVGFSDPTVFDFDGQLAETYNLLGSQWGFVVDRDIEWQQVVLYAAGPLTISQAVDPGDGRLLVFANGLWLSPDEYSIDIDGVTVLIGGGPVVDTLYHFVRLTDRVFLESVQIDASDLDALDTPQDFKLGLKNRVIDVNRNSVLLFTRVVSGQKADGGYFQVGRSGFASRDGADFRIENGFQIVDTSTLRLRGIAMSEGTVVSFGVLCLRGATSANLAQPDSAGSPFYRRWNVVKSAPQVGEALAAPDLDGFATVAPSGGSLTLGVNDIDDVGQTIDGIQIAADFFAEYTLEQPPTFDSETGVFTSPRRITASTAPAWGAVDGFSGNYSQVTLTIDGGAQAAQVADGVRLRAARLVEGLPAYVPGHDVLRVALDGVKLVRGRDYEERSNTSIVIRVPMEPDQILEAWVE